MLESLVEVAKIQSTSASNKIENIATSDKRLRDLMAEKAEPKNRDERGKRWRIGSARPLGTVYLLCISVCITLCIRRLLVKRIDEPANQISLGTSSQLGNLF